MTAIMAMKNINKFKQWTGEKLGREAKTEATEEFKELELEMAMRQEGLEKLYNSAGVYIRAMGKKKEGEDREKSLPSEIFGQAMVSHGGEYAPESAYGQALLRLGAGMERMGRLQEATESALDTMERGLVQMKDYQAARKKLESRRLAYDSVLSKVQKMRKEDVRTEEELRMARAKYEETSEDVHNRMISIQEAEADKLLDLTEFMEAQLEYYKKCADLLTSIKANWPYSLPELASDLRTTKSQPTRSRTIRSTAHAYSPAEDDPPVPQEPHSRPVISTKFKSSSPPSPLPLHLRRTATDSAVLPPRPQSNGRDKPRKVMRVDHAFDAESDSEMSIQPGELVNVLEEVDAGWYIGEIIGEEYRSGLFPATYCTIMRTPPKPPSPTKEEAIEEQMLNLSLRRGPVRPGNTRSQSAGVTPTVSVNTLSPGNSAVRKKPPPPPVSRGSKPLIPAGSATTVINGTKCRECGCDEFRANVFKKGSCNNCFHVHIPQ